MLILSRSNIIRTQGLRQDFTCLWLYRTQPYPILPHHRKPNRCDAHRERSKNLFTGPVRITLDERESNDLRYYQYRYRERCAGEKSGYWYWRADHHPAEIHPVLHAKVHGNTEIDQISTMWVVLIDRFSSSTIDSLSIFRWEYDSNWQRWSTYTEKWIEGQIVFHLPLPTGLRSTLVQRSEEGSSFDCSSRSFRYAKSM